jgi:Right handed beta helix region/Secretion system C-terminal sorting domain
MTKSVKKYTILRSLIQRSSCMFLCFALSFFKLNAQIHTVIIDSTVSLIDGLNAAYTHLQPGDTVYLKAGTRGKLLIRNFTGAAGSPFVFMNKDGVVTVSTEEYYGISIVNCRYIRLSGQGNSTSKYGIQIKKVTAGAGIGVGSLSSDFEIDHLLIENCLTGGIYAKTDPDCSFKATREKFTQFNTSIHDNYIANVGNEGMYIGSSFYSGMTITCGGKDTVVMPPVLNNVSIYNNVVNAAGWDGIQVSSAPLHCYIFNNTVLNDSQAEMPNQMSGILIGGGSKCDCNNNFISNGKGDGIEYHGLGANRIFNNIIIDAGKTFSPDDPSHMKYGIFVSDVSMMKDSAVTVIFNNIIHPKSDGIRFQSIKSKHSLIASNLIVNPGNYNLYETDNTSFSGKDAYVMLPDAKADVQITQNYFTRNVSDALISLSDYSVLPGSPLINKGNAVTGAVLFDFRNHRRPAGGLFDIGAMEYDGGIDSLMHTFSEKPLLSPNPVHASVTLKFLSIAIKKTAINIYTLKGELVLQQYHQVTVPGIQELHIPVDKLSAGVYFYSVNDDKEISSGKFIKL